MAYAKPRAISSMSTYIYRMSDQEDFALLSGDFNPLHLDRIVARRTSFGRPLVHGIHLLLTALEALEGPEVLTLKACKASFMKGVGVDEPFGIHVRSNDAVRARVEIRLFDSIAAKLSFDFEPEMQAGEGLHKTRSPSAPVVVEGRALRGMSGELEPGYDTALFERLFPRLAKRLAPLQAGVLLATTRLVGMVCPGLDSIYSSCEIRFWRRADDATPSAAPNFRWRVASVDERFGFVVLAVEGASFEGEIEALMRPRPVEQASCEALRPRVTGMDFRGRKSLVIGGSRGLGEICAKLLGLGGADVLLTYHQGREDAERVVAEINAHGGTARCARYDATEEPEVLSELLGPEWFPTEVYYYATPPLIVGDGSGFSFEVYEKYRRIYVDGFVRMITELRNLSGGSLWGFFPSSVAVEETPAGWAEYAAAKAEGEAVCRYLEKALPETRLESRRLPRMSTDLTATVMPVESADAVEVLLETLHSGRGTSSAEEGL